MGLSKSEKAMLDRLTKKAEEPDPPQVSKSVSATVDLSDPKSIAAAIKHGFLTEDEVEDLKDDDDDDKKKKDATPKRRSYFKENGDDE